MLLTYTGLKCRRKNGKLVIEIPEAEVLRDLTDLPEPSGAEVSVRDREDFLDELASEIPHVEHDGDDYAQSAVRWLVRGAVYRVAEADVSAHYREP